MDVETGRDHSQSHHEKNISSDKDDYGTKKIVVLISSDPSLQRKRGPEQLVMRFVLPSVSHNILIIIIIIYFL